MQEGRILAATHDGAYLIRLEGDVRLTLCTTIDDYFQKMFDVKPELEKRYFGYFSHFRSDVHLPVSHIFIDR